MMTTGLDPETSSLFDRWKNQLHHKTRYHKPSTAGYQGQHPSDVAIIEIEQTAFFLANLDVHGYRYQYFLGEFASSEYSCKLRHHLK